MRPFCRVLVGSLQPLSKTPDVFDWSEMLKTLVVLVFGSVGSAAFGYFTGLFSGVTGALLFAALLLVISVFATAMRLAASIEGAPRLDVQSVLEGFHDYCLEVTNRGRAAEFQAQVEIRSGGDCLNGIPPSRYVPYWEIANSPAVRLLQAHTDRLLIATRELAGGIALASFKVHFFDQRGRHVNYMATHSWGLMNDGTDDADMVLRITISSEPPMERPYVHDWRLKGRAKDHLCDLGPV